MRTSRTIKMTGLNSSEAVTSEAEQPIARALLGAAVAAGATTAIEQVLWSHQAADVSPVVLWFGLLFAGAAAVLVGWPAHLLLRRLKIRALAAYLVVGLVPAVIVAAAFGPQRQSWHQFLSACLAFAPAGLTGAATFWAIAVRRTDKQR